MLNAEIAVFNSVILFIWFFRLYLYGYLLYIPFKQLLLSNLHFILSVLYFIEQHLIVLNHLTFEVYINL